jgi:deazaflavin-dependent oxidoreductase (nitroreductase family)
MSIPTISPGTSAAHRLVSLVALSPWGLRFIRDVGDRIDPMLLRLTGGRISSVWPFPALLMTHTGARSGKKRTSALVYFTDRGRVVLIATNFGAAKNPAWYHNLKTNPIVGLYGRGFNGSFGAEEVYGNERERLFRRAKDAPGPYGKYEQSADAQNRPVPVMVLSPLKRSGQAH